jgi:hypothetical protein
MPQPSWLSLSPHDHHPCDRSQLSIGVSGFMVPKCTELSSPESPISRWTKSRRRLILCHLSLQMDGSAVPSQDRVLAPSQPLVPILRSSTYELPRRDVPPVFHRLLYGPTCSDALSGNRVSRFCDAPNLCARDLRYPIPDIPIKPSCRASPGGAR